MNISHYDDLVLHDHEPTVESFRSEVLEGLLREPKHISSKFFYDGTGSALFEEITRLPEYYLTRTEVSILRAHLGEIRDLVGESALVIEFGTGAGLKTRMLLEALDRPAAYVPIDISREQLIDASLELIEAFPDLEIWPVCADYTERVALPRPARATKQTVVFFPGSTIGNFTPQEAAAFLRTAARTIGPQGTLLIGFDRTKERSILEAAYNDRRGVTAAFNLNLIARIEREFGVRIPTGSFEHYAAFDPKESRIEMHLVSTAERTIRLDERDVHFKAGEHVVTEYSYKYSREAFARVAQDGGFELITRWTDPNHFFDVWYCAVKAGKRAASINADVSL